MVVTNLHVKMVNASRKICSVMATLRVKIIQTRTIVNASKQKKCATEQMIVITKTTKTTVVS